MDVNTISTFIASVGVPSALCFVFAYVIYKMTEQHKEETTKMTDALNNNTLAIQKLSDRLDELEKRYEKK